MLSVTEDGRQALADHLRSIGDRHRLWAVTFDGVESLVAAESRANARYDKWLEISDCFPDLKFRDFQELARVRLARREAPQ
ncbi:MAG: hypothetical protein AAGI03_06825 [Pseudomonadota bacterium]